MPDDGGDLGPLPAGTHGFTPEQVAHNQRERILAAVVELVSARGYPAVTVADITKLAHVSKRTFYEMFKDKEECFLAALEIVAEYLRRLIAEAVAPVEGWPQRVSVAVWEILRFLVSEPQLAKVCMVDSLTAGPRAAARYQEVIVGFIPLLRPGRKQRRGKSELPESTEGTIIGSIASLITREILAGKTTELETLHEDFVTFALTPYLGAARAGKIAREAAAPTG